MKTRSRAFHPLVAAIEDVIAAAKTAKLNETAALLRIARLDLLMRVHGIKPGELELLTFAMEKAGLPAAPARRKPRGKLH